MTSGDAIGDETFRDAFTGAYGEHRLRRSEAIRFLSRYGSLASWHQQPLDEQLATPAWAKPIVAWAVLTHRLAVSVDYVVGCQTRWGAMAQRLFPDEHARFVDAASALGFNNWEIDRQWSFMGKFTAVTAVASPLQLTTEQFDVAHKRIFDAVTRLRRSIPKTFSTPVYGLQATLFHLGVLDRRPPKRARSISTRQVRWEPVDVATPALATTMHRYLDQVALTLRPGTVEQIDTSLRIFAHWLHATHPDVTTVAQISRTHIEAYKAWLPTQDGYHGKKLGVATITHRLGDLRAFFDRTIEWGWHDAPARPLLFAGDLPRKDRPLPRFLDDAAAAALLRAAHDHDDPLVRLIVVTLARTGLRKGELLALTVDAVVQIGVHHWLRVPLGKLHTDRYIPLHPAVKALLDDWVANRPEVLRTNLLFTDRGRQLPQTRVDTAVADCAARAGLDHVTPHQLRHTLATQAINRGMSLEAIAALLGHNSLTMTMTYARIADRTVADEYFAVSKQVEALYQQPTRLPADAEGENMRRLRAEANKRLLGNGWCTRPIEIDCRYETICEGCTFFATTPEFRPTLQAQHDDSAARGQTDRVTLYQNLLTRLDERAS